MELFGDKPASLTHCVPPYVAKLAVRLPGGTAANLDSLLQENTLYPLFQQFYDSYFTSEEDVHTSVSGLQRTFIRIAVRNGATHVCAKCLGTDFDECGTPYIHRSHQIPGITICWRHMCELIDCCPFCRCPIEKHNSLFSVPWSACICGHRIQTAISLNEFDSSHPLSRISAFANDMLCGQIVPTSREALAETYKQCFSELGFGKGTKLDRTAILVGLEEFYGKDSLATLDTAYRHGKTRDWVTMCKSSAIQFVPLGRHLLTAYFLFRTPQRFKERLEEMQRDISINKYSAEKKPRRVKAIKPRANSNITDTKVGIILDEISTSIRTTPSCSLDDLWKSHRASMRYLVKKAPTEIEILRKFFSLERSCDNTTSQHLLVNDIDHLYAVALRQTALSLYASNEKPCKVTRTRIIDATTFPNKKWPDQHRLPESFTLLNEYQETSWHFYARRFLWSLLQLGRYPKSVNEMVDMSGVWHHHVLDLLEYFKDIRLDSLPKNTFVLTILSRYHVSRQWMGPHPEIVGPGRGRYYIRKPKGNIHCRKKYSPATVHG